MVVSGKVIRFDEFRGYGFVSPDTGGEDVFIHVNDIDFDKRLLTPGAQLEFVTEEGDRGLKASQVTILERASMSAPPLRAAVSPELRSPDDDGLCDVLSTKELLGEFTEALLTTAPSLTGQQILAARECLVKIAHAHGWLEE